MTNFKPMLAKDGDPATLTYPVAVQPKLDGIRASVVNGKLLSRTLKPIPNAEIRAALERPEFEGFDGEIIVGPSTAEDCYRRTASFTMAPNKTGEPWTYQVFDKWDAPGGFGGPFEGRYQAIYDALTGVPHPVRARVKIVTCTMAHSPEAVEALEELTIAQGGEGIIVRIPDAPYKFGRSGKKGPLLKVKRFIDFEAEIIGVEEEMHNANEAKRNELGRTERSTAKAGLVGKGTLGALIVRAINGPHEGAEFKVGTGFDAAQRADLWAIAHFGTGHDQDPFGNTGGLNGRVIKVKSFPIGVKDLPRHPVFLGFRDMELDS